MFEDILANFGAFVGFAALVSLIVNILKYFGIVKEGDADKWVAGFNLVGIIAIYVLKLVMPDFDPLPIDSVLGQIAAVGIFLFQYILMLLGSRLSHFALRGLPVVGHSFTLEREKRLGKKMRD